MKKNINKSNKNIYSKSGVLFYKKHENDLGNRGICCNNSVRSESDN